MSDFKNPPRTIRSLTNAQHHLINFPVVDEGVTRGHSSYTKPCQKSIQPTCPRSWPTWFGIGILAHHRHSTPRKEETEETILVAQEDAVALEAQRYVLALALIRHDILIPWRSVTIARHLGGGIDQ